MSTYLFVSFVV